MICCYIAFFFIVRFVVNWKAVMEKLGLRKHDSEDDAYEPAGIDARKNLGKAMEKNTL